MAMANRLQAIQNWIASLKGTNPALLGEYTRTPFWRRQRLLSAGVYLAALAAFGVTIGLTAQNYIMLMMVPIALLCGLIIWALPETKNPPLRLIDILLVAFLVALMGWPDYLALSLPGLPWITAIRLTMVPLALILLTCLSVSRSFREQLVSIINTTPLTWKFLVIFSAICGLSIAYSINPSASISRFVVSQFTWTLIFFSAAWVFTRPGRATFLAFLLWGFSLYVIAIGLVEWRMNALPWVGRIPSFLVIEDPTIEMILSAKARAATGIYRVQSKFTTPLGLAEFLAYTTPFVLYFLVYSNKILVKAAALLSLPLILYCIILTDSRLGFVGFCLSILLFAIAWAVLRWMKVRGSLLGPAITIAYPAVFMGFIAATFLVGRLRAKVWGTGAHSFSTHAREEQWALGMPMIFDRPWGYGMGQGAAKLGYVDSGGVFSIDSYFLLVGLDVGVLGFLAFLGIFVPQLMYVVKYLPKIRTMEHLLIIPLTISIANFLVIKVIFAQTENHPLSFACLGAISAMLYRLSKEQDKIAPGDTLVFTNSKEVSA